MVNGFFVLLGVQSNKNAKNKEGEMDMASIQIYEGNEFYDSLNGRYIKVESVDRVNKTAMCIVDESMPDEEASDETKIINGDIYYELFNIREFSHFKLVKE